MLFRITFFQFLYVYYKIIEKELIRKKELEEEEKRRLGIKTAEEQAWIYIQLIEDMKRWIEQFCGEVIKSLDDLRDGKVLLVIIEKAVPSSVSEESKMQGNDSLVQSRRRVLLFIEALRKQGYASQQCFDPNEFVCRADAYESLPKLASMLEFLSQKTKYEILNIFIRVSF